MAQKRDLFDDIIDISKDFSAIKNPLSGMTDALMGKESPDAPHWNPADYKEKPRANTLPCLVCKSDKSTCSACLDACPVDAVQIEDGGIDVTDACRKCGLCVSACPTESFVSVKLAPKKVYDRIAAAAASHETAYVTCTRALRRMPRENEVVVACVGAITAETWFSILLDCPNVSVYLPLGICDRCKTTTGEEALGEHIAQAEEWAGEGLGLEVEPGDLVCVKRREFERKEFMDKVFKTTGLAVTKANPVVAAATSVAARIKDHATRISQLEKSLNAACGVNTQKRRRILTQSRQLMLAALQQHPEKAENVTVLQPECDYLKCSMCGECVRVCPTHANDLINGGRFTVEPTYCLGCGLCAEVCEPRALTMVEHPGEELVVPDPEAEKRAADAAKAREEAKKLKAEGKEKINALLDKVEKLADE